MRDSRIEWTDHTFNPWRLKAKVYHPDTGGSDAAMARINGALKAGLRFAKQGSPAGSPHQGQGGGR